MFVSSKCNLDYQIFSPISNNYSINDYYLYSTEEMSCYYLEKKSVTYNIINRMLRLISAQFKLFLLG